MDTAIDHKAAAIAAIALPGGTGGAGFYRVDRFAVPAAHRDEFLARVERTHELLRRQAGFIRDYILEREGADGTLTILTFVEWESDDVIEAVAEAVTAMHRTTNFDREAFLAERGIRPEIESYRRLPI